MSPSQLITPRRLKPGLRTPTARAAGTAAPRGACVHAVLLLVLAIFFATSPARAASCSSDSNATTVDTQDSLVTVSGRLLDSVTGLGLDGVTVTLGGQTTTTANGGRYTFNNVSLAAGSTVTATRAGQVIYNAAVQPPAGARQVLAPDARVAPTTTAGKPGVTSVVGRFEGIFLNGLQVDNEYTATVNWNGGTPGSVAFYANNQPVSGVTGSGGSFTVPVRMDQYFQPSFRAGVNQMKVVATSASGVASVPVVRSVSLIPGLNFLNSLVTHAATYASGQVGLDVDFPSAPIHKVIDLPVFGKFGAEAQFSLSADYSIPDGELEIAFGVGETEKQGKRGRRPDFTSLADGAKAKLYLGNKEIAWKLEGGGKWTLKATEGVTTAEVFVHASVDVKLELARAGVGDLLAPGLSSSLSAVPGLESVVRNTSVILWGLVGADGQLEYALLPEAKLKNLEFTGKTGLEASYEPKFTSLSSMRLYIGGEPSFTLQYPGDLFKQVRFKLYAGAEFHIWLAKFSGEYVFVDFTYPTVVGQSANSRIAAGFGGGRELRALSVVNPVGSQPVDRPNQTGGPERFVVNDPARRVVMSDGAALTPLEAFRALGQGGGKKGVIGAAAGQGKKVRAQTPQANLPLLQNVFPEASPALAGRGQELMLLYVTDNGQPNSLQFTDINWTRFDGVNWSAPAALQTDTRAEFAPQVAYDGAGGCPRRVAARGGDGFQHDESHGDGRANGDRVVAVEPRGGHVGGARGLDDEHGARPNAAALRADAERGSAAHVDAESGESADGHGRGGRGGEQLRAGVALERHGEDVDAGANARREPALPALANAGGREQSRGVCVVAGFGRGDHERE